MRAGILLAAVAALLVLPSAHAFDLNVNVSAGITPDNPLWKLDLMFEKLELMLTFSEDKKIEKQMRFAEERLEEAEEMVAEDKTEHALMALEKEKEIITMMNMSEGGGVVTAAIALDMHRTRLEERKKEILERLPEDSPAREVIEQKFDEIEEHAEKVREHLEIMREIRIESIKEIPEVRQFEAFTGVDVAAEYGRLLSKGRVSPEALEKAVWYINLRIEDNNVNLSGVEGKTLQINIVKAGEVTQTIFVRVTGGKLTLLSDAAEPDYTLSVNVEDIPGMVEDIMEGDYGDAYKTLAKGCKSVGCLSLARDISRVQRDNNMAPVVQGGVRIGGTPRGWKEGGGHDADED